MAVKARTVEALRVRVTIFVEIDYGFCNYAPHTG
jgi:hypothetical protein